MRPSRRTNLLVMMLIGLFTGPAFASDATYRLVFESGWSNATHPGNYPNNAHFSPLIGGTHNGGVSFWEVGELASNAIEAMAETGATNPLRTVMQNAINNGTAASIEQSGGINAPGSGTHVFDVSSNFPELTLVTMIAPSPDWFVGVSGLDFRQGGQWVESLTIELNNYDAGTDSGVDFTSPNQNTNPAEPISVLGSPLAGTPSLGTFTFTLVSTTGALCDFDGDQMCGSADLDAMLAVGPIQNGVSVSYGTNDIFDLNGDGTIDLGDRDDWLAGAAVENGLSSPYKPSDANLDGVVDGNDFLSWNQNKFTASLAASDGDFNGDGFVDGVDFTIWNQHKFTASDVATVPEPTTWLLGGWMVALLIGRCRRQDPSA